MENYNKRNKSDYTINIDNMVYQKIMHWVDKASGEVSGLGKLIINKDTKVIDIKSAILLKQENSGSSTDIDAAATSKAMFELRDEPGDLNFWWHSHVNMDVFWSGTDIDTIEEIGNNGFLVATVFNKRREMKSALYYPSANPIFQGTLVDNINTIVVDHIAAELIAEWDKEFEEKCKPLYIPTVYSPGVYGMDYSEIDWYKSYGNGYVQTKNYDFNDHAMTLANDDAKIYSIKPQLEILKDEMLKAPEYKKARRFLNKISERINKLKLSDDKVSYAVKKEYFDAFNQVYPTIMKGNK